MIDSVRKLGFFPSISRFITERWKIILVGLVSVVTSTGIVFQGVLLQQNLQEFNKIEKEKISLASQLSYWEQIVKEYDGYRDAYLRIASLQISLGKIDEAKESLKKVLSLDPNLKEANLLVAKIEAK